MDIIVEGIGKKFYSPDEVEINLDFYTRDDSYKRALENGTKNVESFINDVLERIITIRVLRPYVRSWAGEARLARSKCQ